MGLSIPGADRLSSCAQLCVRQDPGAQYAALSSKCFRGLALFSPLPGAPARLLRVNGARGALVSSTRALFSQPLRCCWGPSDAALHAGCTAWILARFRPGSKVSQVSAPDAARSQDINCITLQKK